MAFLSQEKLFAIVPFWMRAYQHTLCFVAFWIFRAFTLFIMLKIKCWHMGISWLGFYLKCFLLFIVHRISCSTWQKKSPPYHWSDGYSKPTQMQKMSKRAVLKIRIKIISIECHEHLCRLPKLFTDNFWIQKIFQCKKIQRFKYQSNKNIFC